MTLKAILEEHRKITRAHQHLETLIWKSKVLAAELEHTRSLQKENDVDASPYYRLNEALMTIHTHLKPIFERQAGVAAIRENPS